MMIRHQKFEISALLYAGSFVLLFIIALTLSGLKPYTPGKALTAKVVDSLKLTLKTNPRDGAEIVFIPAGEFIMGRDKADIDDVWKMLNWDDQEKQFTRTEQPAHRVRVNGFWMYRTLVTVAQYRQFCKATGKAFPKEPSYGWKEANPIVNVSWDDATSYCKWAGSRLPYEAEWEYAASAGHTGFNGRTRWVFIWGDKLPASSVGNLADETFMRSGYYNNPNFHYFKNYTDGYATASPVTAFPPNEFGLYDMAGNVLEWCHDWYGEDYYAKSPGDNPRGPATGNRRVLRGGAFDTTPTITRITRRLGNFPQIQNEEKGFRCVM
jgi:formylglycine-generating enzyme required for sulfatase activity